MKRTHHGEPFIQLTSSRAHCQGQVRVREGVIQTFVYRYEQLLIYMRLYTQEKSRFNNEYVCKEIQCGMNSGWLLDFQEAKASCDLEC